MCPFLTALCWGKLDFPSVATFILHHSYITGRYYVAKLFSGRDSLSLRTLFWLVFIETNIVLQTGINALPSLRLPKEWC